MSWRAGCFRYRRACCVYCWGRSFSKIERGNRIALYIGPLLQQWVMSGPRGCLFVPTRAVAFQARACKLHMMTAVLARKKFPRKNFQVKETIKVMFPFSASELARRARDEELQRKLASKPQGFFNQRPMSRRDVMLKAECARLWLETTLREPMPARQVFELARLEGIPSRGARRAKRHPRIKFVKTGGKQARVGRAMDLASSCVGLTRGPNGKYRAHSRSASLCITLLRSPYSLPYTGGFPCYSKILGRLSFSGFRFPL